MSKPIDKSKLQQQEIRYRDRIIFALLVILVIFAGAYIRFPQTIEVHNIPSLENKLTTKIGYMPPSSVYSFAIMLWETINYCEADCGTEYVANLNRSRPFLTEACYFELKNHAEKNKQLLQNRSRQLTMLDNTIFDFDKVKQVNKDAWVVTETFGYDETVGGNRLSLRKFNMKYPLRVIRTNVSENFNPYQLQLDCFADKPERVEDTKSKSK